MVNLLSSSMKLSDGNFKEVIQFIILSDGRFEEVIMLSDRGLEGVFRLSDAF